MNSIDPWVEDTWLAAMIIPRNFLLEELSLAVSKWPYYRFMTPLQATRLFKDAYVAGYRRYHARNIDRSEAEKLQIGRKLDLTLPRNHNTQLWRARQIADHFGMPYGAYMEFAFTFAEARRRKFAPQPNQLGPSQKSMAAWCFKLEEFWTPERKWLALQDEKPMLEYRLSNDIGVAMQAQFRTELLELGRSGVTTPNMFLELHVVSLEQLSPEECQAAFPSWSAAHTSMNEMLEAKRMGRIAEYPYPEFDRSRIRPSCFSLPGIDATTELQCQACSLQSACHLQRCGVLDQLTAHFGTTDPIAQVRRAKNAERQHRSRARKKGILLTPPPEPKWRDLVRNAVAAVQRPQHHLNIDPGCA